MLSKIETTKQVREICRKLDEHLREKPGQWSVIFEIQQMLHELEDGLNEPKPKTFQEALQQFQQHQDETHKAQVEFLEGLNSIAKNIK